MSMRIMTGSVALTMLWLWLGFLAICAVGYWLFRNRRYKSTKDPPKKYAKELGRRLQRRRFARSKSSGGCGNTTHELL